MDPSDYKTFAAYYHGADVVFGLTNVEFEGTGWHEPHDLGVHQLDYAVRIAQEELKLALARASMDVILQLNVPLREMFHPLTAPAAGLDAALRNVFWEPYHYLRLAPAMRPDTIPMPQDSVSGLFNFSDNLGGQVREGYLHLIDRLPPPAVREPVASAAHP